MHFQERSSKDSTSWLRTFVNYRCKISYVTWIYLDPIFFLNIEELFTEKHYLSMQKRHWRKRCCYNIVDRRSPSPDLFADESGCTEDPNEFHKRLIFGNQFLFIYFYFLSFVQVQNDHISLQFWFQSLFHVGLYNIISENFFFNLRSCGVT
jgi:hypothetical protein